MQLPSQAWVSPLLVSCAGSCELRARMFRVCYFASAWYGERSLTCTARRTASRGRCIPTCQADLTGQHKPRPPQLIYASNLQPSSAVSLPPTARARPAIRDTPSGLSRPDLHSRS
ncbi:uncharacterized protein CC84DRAFT_521631 [Paraphaeosphaeria sporulosa]|uniref:Uncharacterized protein n=1 Tax=Paraphaeosphaeria sporulosa TaxID=1460663 RepID=A0A177CKL7_9PLEO|nr:uncharacterized protein CC84DRAFT_521631 [Paraphaeosphaeria sporulosa]OAG07846.1 hypothetical protein CC84DRAFT_521631 [Paraphaeosphaeria sporulosa]